MSAQEEEQLPEPIDEELDDLDDIPGFFHKSSLRERTDPEL